MIPLRVPPQLPAECVSVETALYPLFLKLPGRRVVVVGGGPVAASKLEGLLAAGALVTVVAPQIVPQIDETKVTIVKREFRPSDLDDAWYVVAAAPPHVNREVGAAAEARRLFVNAVDDLASATAYLGAVLRRDGVTVAISTSGGAPALAGLLREGLEALLPHDLSRWQETAHALRKTWRRTGIPMRERRPLLLQALNELYSRKSAEKDSGE